MKKCTTISSFFFVDSAHNASKENDFSKISSENKEEKISFTKNKDNVKQSDVIEKLNTEHCNKKHGKKDKDRSTDSTSEDMEQNTSELNVKSKRTKKISKVKSNISEMEIEEPKNKAPKKAEAVDVYTERAEKRKQHSQMYQQYLHRGGARNPGSKEIPQVSLQGTSTN